MAGHYVIIDDLMSSGNDQAFLDVTSDPSSFVRYAIPPAAPLDPVPMSNGMASSPSLFPLAPALPALIGAETVTAPPNSQSLPIPSFAALRQKKFIMGVPPLDQSQGTAFQFPVGSLGTGAYLLIGNVNAPAVAQITQGNNAPTQVLVPSTGVAKVPLNQVNARVLVVTTGPVFIQFAVLGHGQEFSMTFVLPE